KIGNLINSSNKICSASGIDGCFIFFELTSPENWNNSLTMLTEVLTGYANFGFKLRTGGTEASAFPESSLIAFSISECFKEQIKSARENFIISYGSCSFTEPIDDLKALKLID